MTKHGLVGHRPKGYRYKFMMALVLCKKKTIERKRKDFKEYVLTQINGYCLQGEWKEISYFVSFIIISKSLIVLVILPNVMSKKNLV